MTSRQAPAPTGQSKDQRQTAVRHTEGPLVGCHCSAWNTAATTAQTGWSLQAMLETHCSIVPNAASRVAEMLAKLVRGLQPPED